MAAEKEAGVPAAASCEQSLHDEDATTDVQPRGTTVDNTDTGAGLVARRRKEFGHVEKTVQETVKQHREPSVQERIRNFESWGLMPRNMAK